MNVDHILMTMNKSRVDYLLIGGMNFLLRHQPVLTFDVDIWVKDAPQNLAACERALVALEASWGPDDASWGPVARLSSGWLERQALFCLVTPHGALDIFRSVKGLQDWDACRARAVCGTTAAGITYAGLSDGDMLACQEALAEQERKLDRITVLRRALKKS
jgi:hypothetical protein